MGNYVFGSPTPSPILSANFYAFEWKPNMKNYNAELDGYNNQSGLFVGFNSSHFEDSFFNDSLLYLPVNPSARLSQIIQKISLEQQEITTNKAEVQGFIDYTNLCLNYIYQTQTGKKLLDALMASPYGVAIIPSNAGNHITASNHFSKVSEYLLDAHWRSEGKFQEEILKILHTASKKTDDSSFAWLAAEINKTPLYTMTDHSPFPFSKTGFLTSINKTVTAQQMKSWFTEGEASKFATDLASKRTKTNYSPTDEKKKITVEKFIRLAAIIALHGSSPPGASGVATVSFNVRVSDDIGNEINYLNRTRPPAIGLAHELIHAYHDMRGEQPGYNFGDESTLLYEMLCVGIGPWDDAEITENAVRRDWNRLRGLEKFVGNNNMEVGRRVEYIGDLPVIEEETAESESTAVRKPKVAVA